MVNIALLELTYGMFDSNIIECEGCDAELNIFSRRSHVSSLLVDAWTGEWFIGLFDPLAKGITFNPSPKKNLDYYSPVFKAE